jgi:hypothetical protein
MKAQGYATSPDAHDLEELSIIYEHIDRGGN